MILSGNTHTNAGVREVDSRPRVRIPWPISVAPVTARRAPDLNVLFVTVDQWRGDCLGQRGPSRRAHPEPRPPRRGRRVVPAPLRPGRAVRAEPGVALHGHVPDEPPVGAQRHAARRPPHQRRPGRPGAGLRARALRLHRHERRPPHRRRPTIPRLRTYEGVLPGFDPVGVPARGRPRRLARLDARRRRGRARRLARVRRPAGRGHAVAHAVRREAHARPCSSPIACSTSSTTGRPAGKPWFAHVSYLRPHPPFLAPAPYDTMFDPGVGARPGARRDARRGRRAAPVARPDDQPSRSSRRPTIRRSSASCRPPTTG